MLARTEFYGRSPPEPQSVSKAQDCNFYKMLQDQGNLKNEREHLCSAWYSHGPLSLCGRDRPASTWAVC